MNTTSKTLHKRKVGILFGGQSAEHDVSIQSARNVLEALDKDMFEPIVIKIDRDGAWKLQSPASLLAENVDTSVEPTDELALALGSKNHLIVTSGKLPLPDLDVIFPILHGPLGEDGTIQGLLEIAHIPYVGAGVLGSAIGMDKDVAKRLLVQAGIPVTGYMLLKNSEQQSFDPQAIIAKFGTPLFVKPANMGSSIGVSRAENELELRRAVELGFQYDRKILIEKAVNGDEIECAILGNERPRVSVPGRIQFRTGFYTYDAKYDEHEGTILEIPAQLSEEVQAKVQAIALKTYETLECEGMARVDMFVTEQGDVLVNEINTLPGFTKFSMYPQLWEASGLSYTDLITELLELALDRAVSRNRTSRRSTASQ